MEKKQLDWVAIICNVVIGLLCVAGIIRLWNDITQREAGADTTYRLHWVFAFLYNYLGKMVMFCVLGIVPLIFFVVAWTGRFKDKDETSDD